MRHHHAYPAAFADGRLLRERSRMRRRARRHGTNPLLVAALVFLIMSCTGGIVVLAVVTGALAAMLAPVAVVGGGVYLIHRVSRPRGGGCR